MLAAMPTTLVMLPPQSAKTRAWAARLTEAVPALSIVVAETEPDAARAIVDADAAYGTISDTVLAKATKLRWLQAPQAAPPAGYYTPALVAHPVAVTNFREIYNDLIGAHIMAFVLAFARGFHLYFPRQLRRVVERSGSSGDSGPPACTHCTKPIRASQVTIHLRDGRQTHVACAIMHGEWRSGGSAAAPPTATKRGAA